MAAYYVFKQVDIDSAAANGITLYINDVLVKAGDPVNQGDKVKATVSSGKFVLNSAGTITPKLYFGAMINNYFFNPVDKDNPTVVIANISTVSPYDTDTKFNVSSGVTEGAVSGMIWVNKPVSIVKGGSVSFTWNGGTAPYSVKVINPDGATVFNEVSGLTTGSYNLNIGMNAQTGNYSITISDSGGNTLTTSIAASAPPAYYNIKQIDLDNASAAHAVLTVGNAPAVLGTPVAIGDVITATADAGYEFAMITNPDIPSAQIASVYFVETSRYGNKNTSFTLSADKKTCSFKMVANSGSFVYSQIKVTSVQLTPDVTGTNNIYKIDKDILAAVNRKRFKIVSDGGTTPNETVYDYGQFILSVLSLPFAIPEQYVLNDENIILANLDTGVKAPALSSDLIKIDMGSITVNPVNNNLLDYINTVAIMRLPRVDSIAIDLEYVIGKTLNIEYLLDCYTGRATVNIVSSETGETVVSKQVDIGVSVPYINIHNDAQLSNDNVEVSGDNGIYTPFIELVKIDTLLSDGMFTIPIIDESELTNQTGFIRIEEINLNSTATRNEKNELVSILRNGVLIK